MGRRGALTLGITLPSRLSEPHQKRRSGAAMRGACEAPSSSIHKSPPRTKHRCSMCDTGSKCYHITETPIIH